MVNDNDDHGNHGDGEKVGHWSKPPEIAVNYQILAQILLYICVHSFITVSILQLFKYTWYMYIYGTFWQFWQKCRKIGAGRASKKPSTYVKNHVMPQINGFII